MRQRLVSVWLVPFVAMHCLQGALLDSASLAAASEAEEAELPLDQSGTQAVINLTYVDPASNRWHTERGESGRFLSPRADATHGVVVHVRGQNGSFCEPPLTSDVSAGVGSNPWIALIQHGGCPLATKMTLAWESNASAIVVYHRRDEHDLQRMNLRMQSLVVVAVGREKGSEIAQLVDNGTTVHMYITVGSKSPRPNINRTSILFVSVSFIVLMIISLAWLIFYYVQRFRYIHAKEQLARRLCSAAKKALAKIPVKNIKEAEGDCEGCAVCLEPYKLSDVVRTLPCKHVFHRSCVDPWLLEHRTCPMCKLDILKYYGLMFTSSQDSILEVEEATLSSMGDRDSDNRSSPAWQRQISSYHNVETGTVEELGENYDLSPVPPLPRSESSVHLQEDRSSPSGACVEEPYATLHASEVQDLDVDELAKENEVDEFLPRETVVEQFIK